MLTHIGSDVGIATGQPPDSFNYRLRFDFIALVVVAQTMTGTPLLDLLPPVANVVQRLLRFLLLQQLQHLLQHQPGIADDRHICRHGFRD